MRLHEGKLQESSCNFSFFLENSSTTPPMKQTCSANGAPFLSVRIGAVAPLLTHVSILVLTWVTLFVNGRGALLAQHREQLQGDNLNLHFSREKFEGLEKTREYLSHNLMVTIFQCNKTPFLSGVNLEEVGSSPLVNNTL